MFPRRLPQINFDCFDGRATKGGFGTTKSSVAAMPEAGRLGKVFYPDSWERRYDAGE
jgi:hypothetical protein